MTDAVTDAGTPPTEPTGLLALRPLRTAPLRRVGTLGPAGTSSEQAANLLWHLLAPGAGAARRARVELFLSYEEAGDALRRGRLSHVVVANAYSAVNEFYMDLRLVLAGVFVMETPHYGVAAVPGQTMPVRPVIASHPAPVPLIDQLLPQVGADREIVLVRSTSAAAQAARDRSVDLALTTAPAVRRYDLEFISRTRTIQMVWSVFVGAQPDGR